jgi:hypothetical protein
MHESQAKSGKGRQGAAPKAASAPHAAAYTSAAAQHTSAYAVAQELTPALPLFGGSLQAKLAVGQPEDPDEHEADAVAQRVMSSDAEAAGPEVRNRTRGRARPQPPPPAATPTKISRVEDEEEQPGEGPPPDEPEREEPESVEPEREEVKSEEAPLRRSLDDRALESSARASRPDGADTEEQIEALRGGGRPLPRQVRDFYEPRFGHDFGGVRVHTGPRAAQTARGVDARAFTLGSDLVFAAGEYAPHTEEGGRLLAHELTHVVQQGGAAPAPDVVDEGGGAAAPPDAAPVTADHGAHAADASAGGGVVQRDGPTAPAPDPSLDAALRDEIDAWLRSVEDFEDPLQKAYSRRVVLLLTEAPNHGHFSDQQALDDFIDQCTETALSELDTLARIGVDKLVWTGAFPGVWSIRVYSALALDVDIEGLASEKDEARTSVDDTGARMPDYLLEHGLPVPFAEALNLTSFHLFMRHADLDREHIVKEFAQAVRRYMLKGWLYAFHVAWDEIAQSMSDQVGEGTYIVDFQAYNEFVDTKRAGLESLTDRLMQVRLEDALGTFDTEVIDLTNVAFLQTFASGLLALVSLAVWWADSQRMFNDRMVESDTRVAGVTDESERLAMAFTWAHENSYFAGAAAQIGQAILEHGFEIIGMAALFIALQFVPVVNVLLDVYILITAGIDAVRAIASLSATFNRVLNATTVVELQSASAHMASSLEGDGLRLLLDVLAIAGVTGSLRARINRIRSANPAISEEAALEQALRETPEAAELAAARRAQEFLAANGNSNTARMALGYATGDVAVAEQLLKVMLGDASADLAVVDAQLMRMAGEELAPALERVLQEEGAALSFRTSLLNSPRNWVEAIVMRRGYPFGFPTLTAFESFKTRLRGALNQYGMGAAGDIRVQGSSVARKVNPPDVDVAILVSEAEYNALRDQIRAGIRNPRILAQFESHWPSGHMNSFYFPRPATAGGRSFNQSIYGAAGDLPMDVSYVLRGGPFDQGPYLAF